MTDKIASKRRWLDLAAVALFFSATVLFFTPAHVYLNNAFDFSYTFREVLPFLLTLTLVSFLMLAAMLGLFFRKSSSRCRAMALLLALGVAFWLQGNVLSWNLGSLAGKDIDWGKAAIPALLDGAIWLALVVLSQWRPAFFCKIARNASAALLLIQLLSTSFYWSRQPDLSDFKKFAISNQKRFVFSSKRNVIILLLDNFQSDLFQEVLDENPKLRRTFTGFTYFRNNLGGFPVTYGSIPLILTGNYYDNSQPVQAFLQQAYQSPSSIPKTLKGRGFSSDFFPGQWWPNTRMMYLEPGVFSNLKRRIPLIKKKTQVAFLYDLALFRGLPVVLKRAIYNHQHWTLKNLIRDVFPSVRNAPPSEGQAKAVAPASRVPGAPGRKAVKRAAWAKPAKKQAARARQRDMKKAVRAKLATQKMKRGPGLAKLRRLLPPGHSSVPDVSFMINFLLKAKVTGANDVFKFYHLRGIHDPFRMDENMLPAVLPSTRASWKRIAIGELKLVNVFLIGLRRLGIFDDALIFVLADHGHPHGIYGRLLPPDLAAGQAAEITPALQRVMPGGIPLLLVKDVAAPAGKMAVTDAPVSLQDIAATVFNRMGIRGSFPGRSIFTVGENEPRTRKFHYYDWNFKSWDDQFMPDMHVYEVNGHSWLDTSWQASGRVLRPAK